VAADVKHVIISLMNAIQSGKIYSADHPKFAEFVGHLYSDLVELLAEKKEVVLGIVEGELAWENEIFFGLSRRVATLIDFLQASGINRIVFHQGLRLEELSLFIHQLTRPGKKKFPDDRENEEAPGIQSIKVGRLRAQARGATAQDPVAEKRSQYENSLEFASRSLTAVLNREEVDFLDLRFNILNIMENFLGRHQEMLNLISVKHKDLITFVHLLHVSVLSMFFASRMGFPKEDVLDLGVAALFHDVGKLHIASEILKKAGKLDEDEFARIRDHPVLGSMILQDYRDAMGILPAVVAFEHHLRYDLKGYPKVAYPRQPHTASLIVSLCDVYDALAQKRAYKADFPPEKIFQTMFLEKGRLFDPALLDRFFQSIGVWPVGTIVMLSDERVAVVREVNEQDIYQPKVEVVFPEDRKEIIDLLEKKGAIGIRESLKPMEEAQKYLGYVFAAPD